MKIEQRIKILKKLAQTTGPAPTKPTLAPVPTITGSLFAKLPNAYNNDTVQFITKLANDLNAALHYASGGKDNFNKIIGNNLSTGSSYPNQKNIGIIGKKVYDTFFNGPNTFQQKVSPQQINTWADNIINSPEFNSLSQIKPNSELAIKLGGNLKNNIQTYLKGIKDKNPIA